MKKVIYSGMLRTGGLLILAAMMVTTSAIAAALSGTVKDNGGNAVSGAQVHALIPFSDNIVNSTTTDNLGSYALSLGPGVYDVKVMPPAGSNYGTAKASGISISDDTTLNFVLVPVGWVALTGRVLNGLGEGVPYQEITLAPAGISQTTAADGSYSFVVSPGDYTLSVAFFNYPPTIVPSLPAMYAVGTDSPITLAESTVMDIPLPLKRVTIHVQDPGGNPVKDVTLASTYSFNENLMLGTVPARGYSYENPAIHVVSTDTNGDAVLWLFPNDPSAPYTLTAIPPDGSPWASTSRSGVTVADTNNTVNITLPVPITLSGRVLDGLREGVPYQMVTLSPTGITETTAADGSYSFVVSPGDYTLSVTFFNYPPTIVPSLPAMYAVGIDSPITLAESTVMDIPLPLKRVTVHVQDAYGNSVPNVTLASTYSFNESLMLGIVPARGYSYENPAIHVVSTDTNGDAVLWLFPNDPSAPYTLTAIPPDGSPWASTSRSGVTVADTNNTVNITLPVPITLSGRVLDGLREGVPYQMVTLSPTGITETTAADGSYSFVVSPGDYTLSVTFFNYPPTIVPSLPAMYAVGTDSPITLAESTVMDIPLPLKRVTIHVQDPGGNPVKDVTLASTYSFNENLMLGTVPARGYSYENPAIHIVSTDDNGNAVLWLFPNAPDAKYVLTATPPPESPFVTFNVHNVDVTSDLQMVVVLQSPDSIPPETTSTVSPAANSNGWNNGDVTVGLTAVDNPGGSGVKQISYTLGGAYGEVAGSVTSVNLSQEGITNLTYFAVDNAGNQETENSLTIRIDKTPPVISGLPAANTALWPPNRKMVTVAVVIAADALSTLASFDVTGTSNEPSDPKDPDVVITGTGLEPRTVQLRADRLASGSGRIYTLTAIAIDLAGNKTAIISKVTVPRDQKK